LREKEAAVEALETDGKGVMDMLERMEAELHGVDGALAGLEAHERTARHVVDEHAERLERGVGCLEEVVRGLSLWREEVSLMCW